MSDLTKKDFLYFQNDILADIKKLESKLTEKITNLYSYIQEITLSNEKRFTTFNTIIKTISDNNNGESEKKIISQIERLKKRVEDINVNNTSKITIMQRDLSNALFKYDKIVLDNLKINGLVGEGCQFINLKYFNEYVNKKIKELNVAKDKANNEIVIINEKINDLSTQFKIGLENGRIITNEMINKKSIEIDEKCLGRNNIVEDKIRDMKIENCKYSNDLLSKADDLKVQWEKLESMKNELYTRFDEEKNKFKKNSEHLLHVFNSQKDEFDLIKSRFIEVRDLIKNVRFKKNLNEIVNISGDKETNIKNTKEINALTKKLNFYKKQIIDKKDIEILNREEHKHIILENEKGEDNNSSYKENSINNNSNNDHHRKHMNKSFSPNIRKQNRNSIFDIKSNKKLKYLKNESNKNIYKINYNKNNKISKVNNIQENKINNTNEKNNINKKINNINDNNDNIYDDINENISENENYNDNDTYNMDSYNGMNTQDNNIDDYNNNGKDNNKNELIKIEEKDNNYISAKNISKKIKYTKIKIKSKKIDKNNHNNNINNTGDIGENINTKKIEKNKAFTSREQSKINLAKKIYLINKEKYSENNFAKTSYNINKNKKNLFKINENKPKNSMSSNNINNQQNENEIHQENEEEFSDINFSNNNIRNKILENKNNINITKYSSLSEDEKTYNNKSKINDNIIPDNISKIKYKLNPNNDIKKGSNNNYNIMCLNFGDNSKTNNDNNYNNNNKHVLKKIMYHINLINYNMNEKYKKFSKDIYNNFDKIKTDIYQIYNEINKINAYNFNQFIKGKSFNQIINNFDLYKPGMKLNMNKKIEEIDYHSFFSRNKFLERSIFDEKYESPKSILNNVEPYLIKKFRQNRNNN